jgi:hypothetical protein
MTCCSFVGAFKPTRCANRERPKDAQPFVHIGMLPGMAGFDIRLQGDNNIVRVHI